MKCRGGEEVCEKLGLSLSHFFFFFNQIVIMFKGTKDSCSASYGD